MLTPLIPGEPTLGTVLERTTPRYRAVFKDDVDAVIPAASLTTLLLTLYVTQTNGILFYIRSDQNVLNANNVTVDANGVLVWSIQIADTTMIEAVPYERHVALFEWTWAAGTKSGKHELVLVVKNLTAVP